MFTIMLSSLLVRLFRQPYVPEWTLKTEVTSKIKFQRIAVEPCNI